MLFFAKPNSLTGAALVLHILLYLFFRRLGEAGMAKSFGSVHDQDSKQPVSGAILRFYALPYNKLVETKISDSSGRYSFLVGPGEFYLTVEKKGYIKTESSPIKIADPSGTSINASLPMKLEQ